MKPSGIVTLLTDFGLEDAYVGAMKGAILAMHANIAVIDITHGVRPFAVLQGAFLLDTAWRSFPVGTVHIAVVDPGVGTSRKAIALKAADHIFAGPDNGLFTFLNEPISEIVELAAPPEARRCRPGRPPGRSPRTQPSSSCVLPCVPYTVCRQRHRVPRQHGANYPAHGPTVVPRTRRKRPSDGYPTGGP